MRFHGLMLLRDEEDILAQCLEHLLSWIDGLYIIDLGSTDATWDIVQDFARRDARVVPWGHRPIVYDDCLRCVLFHQFRERFAEGDWVLRIDADEFYHVPPPRFVRERLEPRESAVHLQWYFFRLTQMEVQAYESGDVSLAEDRRRSIHDRRRYYKISEYAEPRMFRYRRTMRWPHFAAFPYNAGIVARQRIPILHYPHRDPEQMQRRYRLRAAMMRLHAKAGGHWRLDDWRQEVVDSSGHSPAAAAAAPVGLQVGPGIDSGPLKHWSPGSPLVEVPAPFAQSPWKSRLLRRLIYSPVLPVLDASRPRFDPQYSPVPISEETNARIGSFVARGEPSLDELLGAAGS